MLKSFECLLFLSLSVSCLINVALPPTSEHCCADQAVFRCSASAKLLSLSARIMMFGIADVCFVSRSRNSRESLHIIYRIRRMDNTDILSFSVMRAVQLVILFSATGYQLYLDWIHYFRYVSSG